MTQTQTYLKASAGDKYAALILQISRVPIVEIQNSVFNYTSLSIETLILNIKKYENVYLGMTINFALKKFSLTNTDFIGDNKGSDSHILDIIANEGSYYSFEGLIRVMNSLEI